jgi:peptidoglycan/xylan/chitin deacetylase (PgdA/CDA1 family)
MPKSKLSAVDLDPVSPLTARTPRPGKDGAQPRIVTTSWDDGDPADLRVAELLAARKLPGTFYIPLRGHVDPGHRATRMSPSELKELADQDFEIGAHGISHPNLPACSPNQLTVEVEGSRKHLEDELGREVTMFAYPRGRHNRKVISALIEAGYAGARTTAMLARDLEFDRYRMPTTIHVFPHTRLEYFRNLARAWDNRRSWAYATLFHCADNWVEVAKILFDSVMENGGVWHLYGHSWEIEELGLWDQLQKVLDYVSFRPGVRYLANGPIVNLRRARHGVAVEWPERTLPPLAERVPPRRAGIPR